MKAAENKRAVIVGIFVLIAIAILVTGIFTLGGQQKRFEKTFLITAIFDDVGGLRKGNNVWFSGVKIGTVRNIEFYGESQVLVTMRIEQDVQRYIKKDSKVKLSSESLIGNKILVIVEGSPDAPIAESGDLLPSIVPLNTEDMMVTLQKNNDNLVGITSNVKELSARLLEGEGTVGALLGDTVMADNFRSAIANLDQVSENTVRASGALQNFTAKLNTEGGLANELLTDTMVFSQLKTAVTQLQQTTKSAANITENLNEATQKLNTSDNGIGILLNDEKFGNQLKNTMGNLETSTEKLDENMEALQHNILFRGFFRRKARQEAKGN